MPETVLREEARSGAAGAAPVGRARVPLRWRPAPFLLASGALHAAAAILLAAAPRAWAPVVGGLLLDHLALAAASVSPRGTWLGPNLTRLPAASRARREVALTFDDGPDPRGTPFVLELLAQARVCATFFCVGRRAAEHPELVAAIARAGHRVENHSHHHPNAFALYGPWRLAREIDGAQGLLTALAGRPPAYFRPPAGIRSPLLDGLLARRGLGLASWTRRGFDAVDRRPERVSRRLLAGLAAGDILVVHDGRLRAGVDPRPLLAGVVPRLLAALVARGLAAVPLPDPEPGGAR